MFKATPYTCFSSFDFYVVANLGSFLLLHVLYMAITEMRIYYVKTAPYACFSKTLYVVANLWSLLLLHVLYMSVNKMHIYYVKAVPGTCFQTFDIYVVAYLGSLITAIACTCF